MPDNEQQIGEWRQAMLAHCDGRDDVVDELEAHLRDVIDELVMDGLPANEAFRAALDRLGHPAEVGGEFVKVPPARQPWLPIRMAWVVSLLLLLGTLLPLADKFRAGGLASLLATHMGSVMLGYTAGLIGGFLAASFLVTRLFHDLRAGQKESLRRAVLVWSSVSVVLTGVGVLLGGWCPHEKTGWCYGLATHEVGGVVILTWGVVTVAGYWLARQSRKLHWTMLLGVLGNVVVVLGWFGTALGGTHSVGVLASVPVVVALVVSQLAVSLTALAPVGWLWAGRS